MVKRTIAAANIFGAFVITSHSAATVGQPGTLDPFWATGSPLGAGKVITAVGTSEDVATAAALQPDGKVLLAGSCVSGATTDFCALRYNANGTLDATWNGTGKAITSVGTGDDVGSALALQPDGKVLVAGYCSNGTNDNFCAIRYNANGTLDTSWNSTGKVITAVNAGNNSANAIAVQLDGKVVLVGYCSNGTKVDFCAVRYTANGALDTSWNGTGKTITPVSTNNNVAFAVALQPDGKVLLAGYCSNGADFCTVRYNTDGTLDTSWNGTGKALTTIGFGNAAARAIALQPDGKVLLAGYCFDGTNGAFCSVRYNADGALDTSWNGIGTKISSVGPSGASALALALQPDGKALLAGQCVAANADFCTLRYHANGVLDTSWGGNGSVVTRVGAGDDFASALALQPDGKVLLAGYCFNGINKDFCAVRYDGGPFGYKACSLDIDGDNAVTATIDSLIHARIALGITGNAVINGISFASHASRTTWPAIREYLVTQCGMALP